MGVQLINVERGAENSPGEERCQKSSSQQNLPPYCQVNIFRDFMPDKVYFFLLKHGFFNERMLRNWYIHHRYYQLRSQRLSSGDALEIIMSEFKELSFDTIKKIVYNTGQQIRSALEHL